jgi:hypothetical protein
MLKYVTPEESQYYIKLRSGQMHKADAFTRIPDGTGWDHVHYLAHSVIDASGGVRNIEYVYVLVNKSVPGMVKIGMTTNTPDERARQISAATGVATPWIPVFSFKCYRSDLLEAEVHEYFAAQRVNENREMFEIDSYTAQKAIEVLGQRYSSILHVDSLLIKNNKN